MWFCDSQINGFKMTSAEHSSSNIWQKLSYQKMSWHGNNNFDFTSLVDPVIQGKLNLKLSIFQWKQTFHI